MVDWTKYRDFFKPSEFYDDQNREWMTSEFMDMLYEARVMAGIPFVVTSGCRNEDQNIGVGGSPTSAHLSGEACDLSVTGSRDRFLIVDALVSAGFNRIGIGADFVHVDCSAIKDQNVLWLYD